MDSPGGDFSTPRLNCLLGYSDLLRECDYPHSLGTSQEEGLMKLATMLAVTGAICVPMLATPAHAQATRTWVSGVGDDVNPCSRTAPCKTFAGAISKTATNGIINCMDSAGFGALTITKSIEVDCSPFRGGMLSGGGLTALNVNGAGVVVTLRGLSLEGNGTTTGNLGIRIINGSVVNIEKCSIRSFRFGANSAGIKIETTAAGFVRVNVSDCHITDNGTGSATTSGGIVNAPTGSSISLLTVHNTVFSGNTNGITNNTSARTMLNNNVFTNNPVNAIQSDGAAGNVMLGGNTIVANGTGISGATSSFGNNRMFANSTDGTPPTAAGAASSDLGQK